MARNSLDRLNWVKTDIISTSRAEARKIVSERLQINSWGVLEVIPDCPQCGKKHGLVVKAKVFQPNRVTQKKGNAPSVEYRVCSNCGHECNRIQRPRPLPPTQDQIAYANKLLAQRYYEFRSKYFQQNKTRTIPDKLKAEWKAKARKLALAYLETVTNGFPVDKLYS